MLLLDEPFGSLDSFTRGQMQRLFARLRRERQLTSIFVTHDVKETLLVGDSFARMRAGQLVRYRDRSEFMSDPATGIPAEIEFWRTTSEGETAAPARPTPS